MTALVPVMVAEVSAMARAMPKSMTLISPASVTMTLPGLMSRWMIPPRWLYCRASSTPTVMRMASSMSSGDDSWRICLMVRPCTCSMTMYGCGAGAP
jgi:hypothetical protein